MSASSQTTNVNEDLRLYAMYGEMKLVQHAMVKGASINDPDPVEGSTALLEAARNGHAGAIEP